MVCENRSGSEINDVDLFYEIYLLKIPALLHLFYTYSYFIPILAISAYKVFVFICHFHTVFRRKRQSIF